MFHLARDKPALMLAPMQGVTDAPMRQLLCELGVLSACVAEYVRVSQHAPPAHIYHQLVPELMHGGTSANATPIVVQLLGGDAERMAEAAARAAALGAAAIDLNFGCPARTVNRHDGGATLLQEPERLYRIVRAVRAAVPPALAVSAKLRLGWEDPADIVQTSQAAAQGGAAWLTIHGRTRVQGYKPYALWEPIARVQEGLDIPVVVNGDLFDGAHFERARAQTGAIHFMVGRGAIANPHALLQMARQLGITQSADGMQRWDVDHMQPKAMRRRLMRRYIDLAREQAGSEAERFLPGRLKQWCLLVREHGDELVYEQLKRLKTTEQLEQCLFGADQAR